jgi:predicted RNase H-like nuclease (RuvC/YqgF family)
MQGLMLSKALKIQQDKEDDEVARLQNSLEEKENEITSLKSQLAKAKEETKQAENVHNDDMVKMKEQDDAINELRTNFETKKKIIKNCLKLRVSFGTIASMSSPGAVIALYWRNFKGNFIC